MRPLIRTAPALLAALVAISCISVAPPDVRESEIAIAATLDAWHQAAAVADEAHYFDAMTPDAVFLGTDATERWTRDEFMRWSAPFFARDSAWRFDPIERHIAISPDGDTAWFDERLMSASYGECRGSGALVRDADGWKIAQYNLTIPIPNAIADDVVAMIRNSDPE